MGYSRHPQTQNERKGDQALQHTDDAQSIKPKGRVRSGKNGQALPAECDDRAPAAKKDRSRGKASHSPARKAAAKAQSRALK